MSYYLADSNGYIADFASIGGLRAFSAWAQRHEGIKDFLRDGRATDLELLQSALDTADAAGDIEHMRLALLAHARAAKDVLILSDGADDAGGEE